MVNDILLIATKTKLKAKVRNMLENEGPSFRFLDEASAGHLGLEKAYLLNPDIIIIQEWTGIYNGFYISKKLLEKNYTCKIILIYNRQNKHEPIEQLGNIGAVIYEEELTETYLHECLEKVANTSISGIMHADDQIFYDILNCGSNIDFAILAEKYNMELSVKRRFRVITLVVRSPEFSAVDFAGQNRTEMMQAISDLGGGIVFCSNDVVYFIVNEEGFEKRAYKRLYEAIQNIIKTTFHLVLSKPALGINELKSRLDAAKSLNEYAFFCQNTEILEEEVIQKSRSIIKHSEIKEYIIKIKQDIVEMDERELAENIRALFLDFLKYRLDFDAYNYACDKLGQLYRDIFLEASNVSRLSLLFENAMYIEDSAEQIIVSFVQGFRQLYPELKNNRIIQDAVSYMRKNYASVLYLTDVADHLNVSVPHLSALFKKHLGKNFTEYVLLVRMERAKEYLAQNKYKIYEVADIVGFTDVKYFSRLFKKSTGYAPGEYRNSL